MLLVTFELYSLWSGEEDGGRLMQMERRGPLHPLPGSCFHLAAEFVAWE